MLDAGRPLARRIRFARLRPGAHKWWGTQFQSTVSDVDKLFVLLVALTWANASTLLANVDLLEQMLSNLLDEQWQQLFFSARRCATLARAQEERRKDVEADRLPDSLSQRFVAVLSYRLGSTASHSLYERYIKNQEAANPVILEVIQREALDVENFGTESWNPNLELIQRCYDLGVVSEPPAFHRQRNLRESSPISLGLAEALLNTPDHFPSFLITAAEERCREDVSSKTTQVGAVAEREGWFAPA